MRFFLLAVLMVFAIWATVIGFDWAMQPAPERVCDTMASATSCEPSP